MGYLDFSPFPHLFMSIALPSWLSELFWVLQPDIEAARLRIVARHAGPDVPTADIEAWVLPEVANLFHLSESERENLLESLPGEDTARREVLIEWACFGAAAVAHGLDTLESLP